MTDRVGPIEFDVGTNTYRIRYDPHEISPSAAVITALGEITAVDATSLPPLYDAIDPRGLDRLLRTERDDIADRSVTVSFRYHHWAIRASNDGLIEIRTIDAAEPGDES